MLNGVKIVLTAALSVAALTACTVNTAPPVAPAPSVVVSPAPALVTPGSTVVVPR